MFQSCRDLSSCTVRLETVCDEIGSGVVSERRWARSVCRPCCGAAAEAPVAEAAMAGDKEAVRALLKQGVDVNAAQGDGMTALHWAARQGDVELAQMLLYAGANVKAMTRLGGYTPLIMASQIGKRADDRGADQGRRRSEGRRPPTARRR